MYQPKFSRLTSRYVRRELLRLLRRKYLSLLARHVQRQPADASPWSTLAVSIDVSSLRTGIEAMAALPTARREPKPKGCEYERQLKVWKRRRTIARGKVAKYARLVRYHKKPREKQPTDQ
jgi:O6-methylguanine-DNA--protein-cysteine methyltransferase